MQPVSPHFTPIDLTDICNWDRALLPATQAPPTDHGPLTGSQIFSGIPFLLAQANVDENVTSTRSNHQLTSLNRMTNDP